MYKMNHTVFQIQVSSVSDKIIENNLQQVLSKTGLLVNTPLLTDNVSPCSNVR